MLIRNFRIRAERDLQLRSARKDANHVFPMSTPAVSFPPLSVLTRLFRVAVLIRWLLCLYPRLQQKANLARIRDNQRRSRARRREYLQELEQRLRVCELQGIEASTEVQMAARRVADENKHLKQLLHKYGVSDEYIAHYIQANAAPWTGREASQHNQAMLAPGEVGSAARSLQQLMMPRRASHLDTGAQFAIAAQNSSREDSITSGSTTTSSVWESGASTVAQYGHPVAQIDVSPPSMATTDFQNSNNTTEYVPAGFQGNSGVVHSSQYATQSTDQIGGTASQQLPLSQSDPLGNRPVMDYSFSMFPYHDSGSSGRGYEGPNGNC